MSVAEANVAKLGLTLPAAAVPLANYSPFTYAAGFIFLSGQIPKGEDGKLVVGKLGQDMTVEDGIKAARLCGISIVAQLKQALGDLGRVKKIVKINCFINSALDFTQQANVANGCSDILVEVFGPEVGRHARTAVGMAQLPLGVPVEIDAQIEVEGHPATL